jgi:hypothetical protein
MNADNHIFLKNGSNIFLSTGVDPLPIIGSDLPVGKPRSRILRSSACGAHSEAQRAPLENRGLPNRRDKEKIIVKRFAFGHRKVQVTSGGGTNGRMGSNSYSRREP